jgi:hypothetical protein
VGETIAIAPPENRDITWHIEYSSKYLSAITPIDVSLATDAPGWLFQVINSGQSEIRLTGSADCPQGQICPPAAEAFIVSIDAEQK